MSHPSGGTGAGEVARGLEELLAAGRRSSAAYRLAEACVEDHRVQAAIMRMRLDHERHVEELMHLWLEVVGEAGAAAPAQDASAADQPAGPVADVLREGAVSGEAILAAVRTAEAELHDLYDAHVSRGYTEPVRVALARHRREEAAHLSFINEGELWRRPGTDTAAEMLPEAAADEPLASAG